MAIYLAEIDCAIDAAGTVKTLRFSTDGFVTEPSDVPASTYYDARISNPGGVMRLMFSDATTSGQSKVSFGTLELVNIDGGLDYMLPYSFDKRQFRLLVGDTGQPYSSFTVALRGTMETVELSYKSVSVILRDRQAELALLLCQKRYGGTNVLPAGQDGSADILGAAVPRLYGTVTNIEPVLCNTSRLIYQVHDGAINDVQAVYDAGLALTKGADYTSIADMHATAPAAGQYRIYKAGGYFRLGSSPTGQLTCDAQNGATAASRTTAQIIKQIALDMGISNADIAAADVTALDAASSAECGLFIKDDTTGLAAMDTVAASAGAYVAFDRLGVLRMAQLTIPSGTPVLTIKDYIVQDIDRDRSNDANKGLPVHRVTVNYAKNYTVQTSGIAGAVTAARKNIIGKASQQQMAEDASVAVQYLSSPEMTRDTCLVSAADAIAEAARLLAIFKVRRDIFRLTIRVDQATIAALDLGAVVNVIYKRFGMSSGKLLRILGIESDYDSNTAKLTLWG